MDYKALPRLLVILLILSCVVFAPAVPATRSTLIEKMNTLGQDHLAKVDPVMGLTYTEEDMKEEIAESRMMTDIEDYAVPRSNRSHDPKSRRKP